MYVIITIKPKRIIILHGSLNAAINNTFLFIKKLVIGDKTHLQVIITTARSSSYTLQSQAEITTLPNSVHT